MIPCLKEKFRIVSYLLKYPDARLIDELIASWDAIENYFAVNNRETVRQLIRHLITTPLLTLQERYSATFDLNSGTCLNLTYHQYGDTIERGAALARFAQTYSDAGYCAARSELPDFLPMVLEFLSLGPNGDYSWIPDAYHLTVVRLAVRLKEQNNPYAGIFDVLSGLFREVVAADHKGE